MSCSADDSEGPIAAAAHRPEHGNRSPGQAAPSRNRIETRTPETAHIAGPEDASRLC